MRYEEQNLSSKIWLLALEQKWGTKKSIFKSTLHWIVWRVGQLWSTKKIVLVLEQNCVNGLEKRYTHSIFKSALRVGEQNWGNKVEGLALEQVQVLNQ